MTRLFALIVALFALTLLGCATDLAPADSSYGVQEAALTKAKIKCPKGKHSVCPTCTPGKACKTKCACVADPVCVQKVMCIQGSTWSTKTCKCEPTAPAAGSCKADADCHLQANYCGGCFCDALGKGETGKTCVSTVKCFADPCMNHKAVCLKGFCNKI
jgi:hypothetical protein